jgi:uroporphyrinogen-III synthase
MIDVFISRSESDAQDIVASLNNSNYNSHCQSLIKVEFLSFNIKKEFDWVFFSSSNGARSFFQQATNVNAKYAAIGLATASAVPYECDFVGEGTNTEEIARMFFHLVGNERVLFPSADDSLNSTANLFDLEQIEIISTYKKTRLAAALPEARLYLFSSPSNVYAAQEKNDLSKSNCVAYGNATAAALKNAGVRNIHLVSSWNQKEIANDLKSLLSKE